MTGRPDGMDGHAIDVSVVIPARNEALLIGRALASVEEQTIGPERIETVVVVNGSSDATADRVHAFATAHPGMRVRLIEERRPGVARAKNLGAQVAGGRVLLFLDADSMLSPDLAKVVLRHHERGERAASIRIRADAGSDLVDRAFFEGLEGGKRLTRVRANMLFCERELFLAVGGFDERLRHAEDLDLLRRLARSGVRVGHVREAWIETSVRRLHRYPMRLGLPLMLGRWTLGHLGFFRERRY